MEITINLPQLDELVQQNRTLLGEIENLKKTTLVNNQTWYDLETACKLQGSCYNTVKSSHLKQPKGGKADNKLNGVKVWSWESVKEWLLITDSNRAAYLEKYGITVSKDILKKWAC